MDLGSRYLSPWANTSRREVLLITVRSPVIMWPVGLYMNGELAQILECNLCGLVYFGETKGKLHKRICGHRSGIITNVNDIVYQHFTAIVMGIVGHRPFKRVF
jgi:hypothetical protein